MESRQEQDRGESWPNEGIYLSFDFRKLWKWIIDFWKE